MLLLFVQIALIFSFMFNVNPVRMLLGFVYVTVIPGIVITKLIIPKSEKIEQIIFSVGISLAFFMGVGLFINIFGSEIGIEKPLDQIPLLITTSVLIDALAFYAFRASGNRTDYHVSVAEPKKRKTNLLVPFLCLLPLLSIIGALMANVPPHSNNFLLLLMFLVVSILVVSIATYKQLPSETYLVILFAISLALLFHLAFYSNYIVGGDIFSEYYAFNSTLQDSYWDIQGLGRLNAMLSVTILPTVYSTVTGINGTWIFKIIYPSIFALVPLGLYQLFKKQVTEKIAFLAVFFFMSNYVFFWEVAELPRQMIAELFYISLFLTVVNKNLQKKSKMALFIIFSFGLIVSHYAIAYVFLGFTFAFWLFNIVRKKQSIISLNMIVSFATILFAWYIYTSSGSTFSDLLMVLQRISQNFLSDFFTPQSRSTAVLAGLGVAPTISRTFLQSVGQYIFILSELLVVLGVILSLVKYRGQLFRNCYNLFAIFNLGLLVMCIAIPNLAGTFNMERFYHVSLFFLAPFCIIGGIYSLSFISRNRVNVKFLSLIVVLLVLIPVFLFQSGFIYEVAKEKSYSLPLSSYRIDHVTLAYYGVLDASEISSAEWLLQNRNPITIVYSDGVSGYPLNYVTVQNTQSLISGSYLPSGSIIYLSPYIIESIAVFLANSDGNITQIEGALPSLIPANTIYSSGSCEIRITS
jgi:uncharacterized membrane protein